MSMTVQRLHKLLGLLVDAAQRPDDGGTKWNKDGSVSGRTVVILKGSAA